MSLALTAPPFSSARDGVAAVSPPREARSTDLTKTVVPLPFMLTIIGLVVSIAVLVLTIKSDVRLIDEKLNHEKELRLEVEKRRDSQFETLEAKIETAGMRNTTYTALQELAKAQEKLKGQR
jgi:multisubunit Na+/H+ antiporter MnhC subunit